jgi:hypothetical protein
MRRKRAILAALGAAVIAGAMALPALAQEPPPPILGEPLTARAVFVDDIGLKIKLKDESAETTVVNAPDTRCSRVHSSPGTRTPVRSS